MNVALHADETAGIDTAQLATVPREVVPRLVFRFHPSVSFIASPWPIDRIWQANQDDADGEGVVDLGSGGVHLEVRRVGRDVTMRTVSPPRHTFRRTLCAGLPLEAAASAALALDPSFDLTLEIRQFLEDELAVEFTLYSDEVPRGA